MSGAPVRGRFGTAPTGGRTRWSGNDTGAASGFGNGAPGAGGELSVPLSMSALPSFGRRSSGFVDVKPGSFPKMVPVSSFGTSPDSSGNQLFAPLMSGFPCFQRASPVRKTELIDAPNR